MECFLLLLRKRLLMSNLIELLNKINIDIKDSSKIKSPQNFILKLLDELEPQKAVDLLKNLKLSDKEIKDIIAKLSPEKQQLYLNILKTKTITDTELPPIENHPIKKPININNTQKNSDKKIINLIELLNKTKKETKTNLNQEKTKTPENDSSNQEKKISEILNLLINNKLPPKISNEIKKEIKKIKKDLTPLIKKEIEATLKQNKNLLTQKVISKIKKADNFEELITIANKNGLNIKKIISKIIKKETSPKLQNTEKLPKPKIILNNKHFKTKKSHQMLLKQHQTQTNKPKNEQKDILQTLLIAKTPEKKIDSSKKEIPDNLDNIIKPEINHNFEIKHKIIQAKESMKHFSNNLKEAIENYKPPISKLSIELHPKELGKVEVTIIHRGDNLQININSNNQAINFFHTHQSELKNTLVNMGYSGIDMSFNSNQNKENQEKKAFKNYSANKKDKNYDELIIEIPYTYA
jgi:flagellar hook-length control protein FliK